ncbi:MAG: hypothetical protein RIQ60_2131 [Pseudomonadota bacterium]|jgi:PAS domain S-box-containing protein
MDKQQAVGGAVVGAAAVRTDGMAQEPPGVLRRPQAPLQLAVALLLFGLMLSLLTVRQLRRDQLAQREQRFSALTQRIAGQIVERVRLYEYGLRGTRGVMAATGPDQVSRARFAAYSRSRDLGREFPGARGIGVIGRVAMADQLDFVQAMRSEGRTDFQIRQLAAHQGDRLVVRYVEPEADNRSALGLDIASEGHRRDAAYAAMRSGEPMLTRPVTLVQSMGRTGRGLLFLLAAYRAELPQDSAEQRERASWGLAYMPLLIDDVLSGFDLASGELAFKLDDTSAGHEPAGLYASAGWDPALADGPSRRLTLSLYGREWTLDTRALPGFVADAGQIDPWVVGIGGLALTVLLAGLTFFAMHNRRRRWQLRLEQAHLAAIVQSSNDAIVGKALDGTVRNWNRAAERIFGHSVEQALGRRVAELIVPPELQAEEDEILERIRRGEAITPFETVRVCRDGRRIDVSVTVSPVLDPAGRVVGAATTVHDITQRRHSELLFHLAVESSPTAMLMVDDTQRLTLVNRQAEVLLGYARDELLGMALDRLVPDRLRTDLARQVGTSMAQSSTVPMAPARDLSCLRKDGSEVAVEFALAVLDAPQGRQVLASIVDIGERLRTQAVIETALKEKTLLLNEIHHRVKNNLQIVASFLSLQSNQVGDPRFASLIAESEGRVRAMSLMHQVLYEGRDFAGVALDVYLQRLGGLLGQIYGAASRQIVVDIQAARMSLDLTRAIPLGLIVNELLCNAFKHAFKRRASGIVAVELSPRPGGQACLTVRDNGCGVPDDVLGNQAVTLGTQIVRLLAEQIGATLTVSNRDGACFELVFTPLTSGALHGVDMSH